MEPDRDGGLRGGPGGGGAPSATRIWPNCWVGGWAARAGTWWKAACGPLAGGALIGGAAPIGGPLAGAAPIGGRGAPIGGPRAGAVAGGARPRGAAGARGACGAKPRAGAVAGGARPRGAAGAAGGLAAGGA